MCLENCENLGVAGRQILGVAGRETCKAFGKYSFLGRTSDLLSLTISLGKSFF